jgi:glycosyltransferase involved in cell wall biosynthesis
MKVVFDIGVLGGYREKKPARSGIYQVAVNLLKGLNQIGSCDIIPYTIRNNKTLVYDALCDMGFDPKTFTPSIRSRFSRSAELLANYIYNYGNDEVPRNKFVKKIRHGIGRRMKLFQKDIIHPLMDHRQIKTADILHSLHFDLFQTEREKMDFVFFQTVYDLIPIIHPEYFNNSKGHIVNTIVNMLQEDEFAICISESTKNDLLNYNSQISPENVFVISLAASADFYPCLDKQKYYQTLEKYKIPKEKYILSLSNIEPRKNIQTTIKAFTKLIMDEKVTDLYLVLAGSKGWCYDDVFELAGKKCVRDRIIWTGYIDDADLSSLYSNALVFCYPSLYEGFGLPPLEAMQCGTPVITSNVSSLPEVVGNCGIKIHPLDVDALAGSIMKVYNDSSYRERLSQMGIKRAKEFSWEKTAQQVVNAYKVALSRR